MFRGVLNAYTRELIFGVQLENTVEDHVGFTGTDEGVLAVLLSFIGEKTTELQCVAKAKGRSAALEKVVSGVARLMGKKTVYELVNCLRETVGNDFGFESANLLFYSNKGKG